MKKTIITKNINVLDSVKVELDTSVLVVLQNMSNEYYDGPQLKWEEYKFFFPKKLANKKKNGDWTLKYWDGFKITLFKQQKNPDTQQYETIDSKEVDMEVVVKYMKEYKKHLKEIDELLESTLDEMQTR
ncbi:hypothetical protein KQ878_00870 [Mycoplasma zalophidermidis]|uniref:Uncharacterized protein n=1 Tax=Mycoplasma zalophidermidis TaxID=398174 RepID=A0ABS6DSJ8_9MOLU|nr:hypothetical protein [Mycoplasma zalophidermidis]MBU4693438.1 hypothetical protein [Mycoplasma zalophidermidis]